MKLDRKYTNRKALIYARVSSKKQKEDSEGSIAHQRAQIEHALRLGWRREDVELLDGDLGKSGTSTVTRREYQLARKRIQNGEIGGIFASEISRFGRNARELFAQLEDCRDADVKIVLNGEVNDPNNPTQHFTQQVLAIIAEYENVRRTDMMSQARIAKARGGKAVSSPPMGYVAGGKGTWFLDPDPRVQDSIRAVFRGFAETHSLSKAMRRLIDLGISIWIRRGVMISPRKATVSRIERILHNPAYPGTYVYPQRKVDHRAGLTAGGFVRVRKAEAQEMVIIPNHHEAYITTEEWQENLRILAANAPGPDRQSAGDGPALLQGIIRCGLHQLAMSTRYLRTRVDGSIAYAYQCIGDYLRGGEQCGYITGLHLDRAVTAALLQRLTPPEIGAIKSAWESARQNGTSEEHRRTAEKRAALARVEDAKVRLLNTMPGRPHVAEAFQEEFEAAMRNLKELEKLSSSRPSEVEKFTEDAWDELLELAGDLVSIWNANTTENRDRKELARTMIEKVIIQEKIKPGRMTERLVVRIVWADGAEDSMLDVKLASYAHQLIGKFAAAGLAPPEICRQLNAEGLKTTQGNPWTEDTARKAIQSLRAKRK